MSSLLLISTIANSYSGNFLCSTSGIITSRVHFCFLILITFHHDSHRPNLLLDQLIFISHLAVSVQVARRNSVNWYFSRGKIILFFFLFFAPKKNFSRGKNYPIVFHHQCTTKKAGSLGACQKGPIGAFGNADAFGPIRKC